MSSIADSNQLVYERRSTASYWTTHLSDPEQTIFDVYAAHIDGKHVLDLGVGSGRTTPFLAPRAQRYIGLDYSHRMVALCRNRFPALDIQHGDARNLSRFSPNSFDFVLFSFNGIDSVDHEGRMHILQEIIRVLKPGGVFAFSSHDLANVGSTTFASRLVRTTSPCRLLNPARALKAAIRFARRLSNYRRNSKRQIRATDYAIFNDEALEFALLQYYITEGAQKRQLSCVGFRGVETYQDNGEDRHSLYYVAYKPWTDST